jgi:hypothetical protein
VEAIQQQYGAQMNEEEKKNPRLACLVWGLRDWLAKVRVMQPNRRASVG